MLNSTIYYRQYYQICNILVCIYHLYNTMVVSYTCIWLVFQNVPYKLDKFYKMEKPYCKVKSNNNVTLRDRSYSTKVSQFRLVYFCPSFWQIFEFFTVDTRLVWSVSVIQRIFYLSFYLLYAWPACGHFWNLEVTSLKTEKMHSFLSNVMSLLT